MSELLHPAAVLVRDHVAAHWPNVAVEVMRWEGGGVRENLDPFSIVRAEPAEPGQPWLHVTAGASAAEMDDGYGLELFVLTREPSPDAVKLISMIGQFHGDPAYPLSLGQVVELGMPWLAGATCDHLLVTLPEVFDPEFEWHSDRERTVRFIWLMPITSPEAQHARDHGYASLLAALGRAQADVTDPKRASVV